MPLSKLFRWVGTEKKRSRQARRARPQMQLLEKRDVPSGYEAVGASEGSLPWAAIRVDLKAPGYDCSSIAYFKMVDATGALCFPDSHQMGLDVLVMVRGSKMPGR